MGERERKGGKEKKGEKKNRNPIPISATFSTCNSCEKEKERMNGGDDEGKAEAGIADERSRERNRQRK